MRGSRWVQELLSESVGFDLPRLRTLFWLWLFHCVPDLYLLKVVSGALLRAAGARLKVGGVYARGPLFIDRAANLTVGEGTFVNRGAYFQNAAMVSIGKRCQIGPYCVFATTNHSGAAAESLPITIGDDVWVGAGVKVMPGAVIAAGIRVAAGAVVVGRLEQGELWAGVPARQVR